MSQIHGSLALEINTERMAEIVALRVVAMLGGQVPGQGEVKYERDDPPATSEALPPDVSGHRLGRRGEPATDEDGSWT